MKNEQIAVITDQHFGARNDSQVVLNNQKKFYDEVFFPALQSRGITHVIDCGDTFDRRRNINFQTLQQSKQFYFDRLKDMGVTLTSIIGNHTAYFDDSNELNTLTQLLTDYDNIRIVANDPEEITIYGKKFLFLPWLHPNNTERAMSMVAASRADILVSHLQLKGFVMHRGSICSNGLSKSEFAHFDRVWTGHFHSPSFEDNIHYIGSPTETSWADYGDVKGFHIYEPATDTLEMILNPFGLHQRFTYRDGMKPSDMPSVEGRFVIVDVESKTDVAAYRDYMDALYAKTPADVKTNELAQFDFGEAKNIDIENFESTADLMVAHIDETVTNHRDKVKTRMMKYYTEAMHQ